MTRQIRLGRTLKSWRYCCHKRKKHSGTSSFQAMQKRTSFFHFLKTFLVVTCSNSSPDRGPKFGSQSSRPHSRLHTDHPSPILDSTLRYFPCKSILDPSTYGFGNARSLVRDWCKSKHILGSYPSAFIQQKSQSSYL